MALISVPLALVQSLDVDSDDVGALANIPRQIEGVDVGICVKEKKNGSFKVSLRTSKLVNAADVCLKFGGGGHARAGGCSFFNGAEDAEKKIVEASCEAVRAALGK